MADKTIGQLPEISEVTDQTLIPVEDSGTAYHTTGSEWKRFVQAAVADDVEAAETAAQSAAADAASASSSAATATSAKNAILGMNVRSEVLSAGATPTLTRSESGGVVTLLFGLAPGAKGDQGVQGPQGLQGVQGPKGDTGTAVAVETNGMYYFNVDNDSTSPTFGHLFLTYSGAEAPAFEIDANGHLIWTVS